MGFSEKITTSSQIADFLKSLDNGEKDLLDKLRIKIQLEEVVGVCSAVARTKIRVLLDTLGHLLNLDSVAQKKLDRVQEVLVVFFDAVFVVRVPEIYDPLLVFRRAAIFLYFRTMLELVFLG